MREENGLGPLEMGVAGEHDPKIALGKIREEFQEPVELGLQSADLGDRDTASGR